MKKLALLLLVILMAATLAMAQGTSIGNTAYVPTVDVLGAHLNGGRGCAGCHAPHSGARGNGWVVTTESAANNGDQALWGTDTSIIQSQTNIIFDQGDGGVAIPWATGAAFKTDPLFKGVATCLSCHDGNVSKGAMMTGVSWEQAQGMLDFTGTNGVKLYGTGSIPTFLGNDGAGAGDYNNDHPVGPGGANIAAGDLTNGSGGLNWGLIITPGRRGLTVTATPGSQYDAFLKNYGAPAVSNMVLPPGVTDIQQAYVVCTTCHDQHSMVVTSGNYGTVTGGTFQTYFFIRGPYNPGAPYDKTHAPSTMQFCRQCHFPQSNEANNSYNIGTAF